MKDQDRLRLGLTGLARAGAEDANAGHWGAAVLAAHFLCEELVRDDTIRCAIDVQLERLVMRFPQWFTPFQGDTHAGDAERRITDALAGHGPHLRAIGHNIIFAVFALKGLNALRAANLSAHRGIADGIVALMHQFDEADTGGPFVGYADPRAVRVGPDDDIPEYDGEVTTALSALDGFAAIPRIYGGLHSGVVGHLLSLAYASIELGRLGYPELAANASEAHRRYRKLARRPPREGALLVRERSRRVDARDVAYWTADLEGERAWGFGHAFKYPYAYLGLTSCVREPRHSQCWAQWQAQLDLVLGWF